LITLFSIPKHTTEIQYVEVVDKKASKKMHFTLSGCRSEGAECQHIVEILSVITSFINFPYENTYISVVILLFDICFTNPN
jgi:hypothetical protein